MVPINRHWSASLGLPLEIITLCHDDILSMPVSEAGKYAAGPMAQKLASYEWTFGKALPLHFSILDTIWTFADKIVGAARGLSRFPGENTL